MDKVRQKKFGDWARAHLKGNVSLTESQGAGGGYLVPEEFLIGVDTYLNDFSLFHKYALALDMKSESLNVPIMDLAAGHVSGVSPLLAGFTPIEVPEGTLIAETDPVFSNAQLVADTLGGVIVASNQLVEDGGIALGQYLDTQLRMALIWLTERLCFLGVCPGGPSGVSNSPGTLQYSRAVANQISVADITGMLSKLLPASFRRAIWACNPSTLPFILGVSGTQPNQSNETIPSMFCGSLYGRPLFVTENLPYLGGTGDLCLFDPMMYAFGMRSLEISGSKHPKFQTNQYMIRALVRADGLPIVRSTFTLADNTTVAACYIALK